MRRPAAMRFLDAVPALFMAALSALVVAGTLELRFWDGVTPGVGFFPVWLALAGVVLSTLMLVGLARGVGRGLVDLPDRAGALRVALAFAGMAAVALIAPLVGMVPAVAAFMALLLLAVLRQPVPPSLFAIAVAAGGIGAIFVRWLGVALPPIPFAF